MINSSAQRASLIHSGTDQGKVIFCQPLSPAKLPTRSSGHDSVLLIYQPIPRSSWCTSMVMNDTCKENWRSACRRLILRSSQGSPKFPRIRLRVHLPARLELPRPPRRLRFGKRTADQASAKACRPGAGAFLNQEHREGERVPRREKIPGGEAEPTPLRYHVPHAANRAVDDQWGDGAVLRDL